MVKSLFLLFVMSITIILDLHNLAYANQVSRGQTISFSRTFYLDANSSVSYEVPIISVSCRNGDTSNKIYRVDCWSFRNLLNERNPSSFVLGSMSEGHKATGSQYSPMIFKYILTNENDPDDVHVVSGGACFLQINTAYYYPCNAAMGTTGSFTKSRRYILTFGRSGFRDVPDGTYINNLSYSIMDWDSGYPIVHVNLRLRFVVRRANGTPHPSPDGVTIHALNGNTIPIQFVQAGRMKQGMGSLDFCVQSDDYNNMSMSLISVANNIRPPKDSSIGEFTLVNVSNFNGTFDNSAIPYRVSSQTLGLTRSAATQAQCSSNQYGFCSNVVKTINFSRYPEYPAPGGGSCKRFDLRLTTEPFSEFQKIDGDYSGLFYLNIDRSP
ncbi:hypothetical protein [Ferrimonas balearica]|uniref:hypothetical protein n=1 Tax=Ferrimonas balearica TaxID=44012 RepID=UPI001C578A5C|nr:hypothetical protein [Ferrimonas balearica]MBW3164056.1 hypothetical protein [Ferrimonas balearica]MBY6224038.1 hypothetical protein [Ferrimonas balearica]